MDTDDTRGGGNGGASAGGGVPGGGDGARQGARAGGEPVRHGAEPAHHGGATRMSPAGPGMADRLLGLLPDLRLSLPGWAGRLVRPSYPGLAVLFDRDRFTLVEIQPGLQGGGPRLTHLSVHDLPPGTLTPGLTELNVAAPAEVAGRLGRALDALPRRRQHERVSVVVSDACARVTLLTLRDIPRSRRQATEMIRWQIRKRIPFQLDAARLTVQRFPLADGSERVVVALGLAQVLDQYEHLFQSLDLHPGLLDLATFTLANMCRLPAVHGDGPVPPGDMAILNVADAEFSVLILREDVPLFYRSKPLIHHPDREPEQTRRELQRELITTATYYRERLAGEDGGLGRVYLRVARGSEADLRPLVTEALGVEPRPVRLEGTLVMEATSAPATALVEAAPALGVVVGRWA